MTDQEFDTSREILASKRKVLKGNGLGNRPNRAEYLSPDMIEKMWENNVLGSHDPRTLQNTIFFYFTTTFGFRGCHESRQLQWGDITLKIDDSGTEFLEFSERLTKTRTGAIGSNPRAFHPKIFANETDKCPVNFYKHYASKRPESMCHPDSPFYLSVKTKMALSDKVWYACTPMGKNSLGKIMSNMAKEAGLNSKITNHSLRKKTCQDLLAQDVPDNLICQLTGHKNVNSLRNYSVATLNQQKAMSKILTTNTEDPLAVVPAKKGKFDDKNVSKLTESKAMSGMFTGATVHGNITINVNYNTMESHMSSSQVRISPTLPKAIE